jgi:hypothetical protein
MFHFILGLFIISMTLMQLPASSTHHQRKMASVGEIKIDTNYAVTCSQAPGDFSFAQFEPQAETYRGKQYPRKNQVLYRGINNAWESNPVNFLKAAFGDVTAFYESWAYQLYYKEFLDRNNEDTHSQLMAYFDYYKLTAHFKNIKTCLQKLPEDIQIKEASFLAAHMIDFTFKVHQGKNNIVNRYLDYASRNYIDFIGIDGYQFNSVENIIGRGELIFLTNNYNNAKKYSGNFILGFYENKDRSVDLNFWNKKNGFKNYFVPKYGPGRGVVAPNDMDEFNLPGYIFPQDIYMIESNRGYALLKLNYQGETIIAVMKAHNGLSNIIKEKGVIEQLNGEKIEAHLMGFIKACDPLSTVAPCSVPKELVNKFTSQSPPDSFDHSLETSLTKFNINGKSLSWLPLGSVKIEILTAIYGGIDVTAKAKLFCNKRSVCNYKIHQKYVFDKYDPDFVGDFVATWKCTGSDEIKTLSVPSPAEDQKVVFQCD